MPSQLSLLRPKSIALVRQDSLSTKQEPCAHSHDPTEARFMEGTPKCPKITLCQGIKRSARNCKQQSLPCLKSPDSAGIRKRGLEMRKQEMR